MNDIIYLNNEEICVLKADGSIVTRKSGFIEGYKLAAAQIARDSEWKRTGVGARFTQEELATAPVKTEFDCNVSGASPADNGRIYYSATIEGSSGIFALNLQAPKGPEGHVIHSSDTEYGAVCIDSEQKRLAASVKTDVLARDIAIFSLVDGSYTTVTSGDSKDDYPYFSRCDKNSVLYSSAGIGRTLNGEFVRFGNAVICSYDTATHEIKDVYADEKHSLIEPKDDEHGNVYFIERPLKEKLKKPNIFLEILMIPFRLVYAVYKFLEAFTKIFTGKGFTTKTEGDNPGKQKSERDIVIDGYKIQAEKNLNAQTKRKEKFPGYAPSSWVLKKLNPNCEVTEIAKGVISFDLLPDGIVYTNGKSIIKIDKDGNKTKLKDVRLALKVVTKKEKSSNGSADIFS